ncbi:MAG TPA: isoprenylcysteine carboxylmethyltransferase family protein [Bryobacteraceae bacterium]|nr:isoprenylcysteine carboxylmethyltransferase family protein [Bryobacteraceae bacterium]
MERPSLARSLLVLAGASGYAGLAIWGEGGIDVFLGDSALLGLMVAYLAITVVSLFAGGNVSPGVREDRSNRWVLVVFGVVGLLAGYLPALTDRADFWTIDGEAVRWVGVAVFSAGGALRLWPVFVLGRRFSGLVAIQPGHTLVTTGIYGVIRHPSYLGALIYSFGWGLAFRSLVGVLLAALLVPTLVGRIRAEERLLASQFGEEYEAYRARTWRLIPGIY